VCIRLHGAIAAIWRSARIWIETTALKAPILHSENSRNVRFNFAVNVTDGGLFGMALGFASFVTVIPLFVNTLTNSSILIGLIASIHMVGWQLPQILTANRVAYLLRFKPMVMFMTLHERWPFFGLALIALFSTQMDKRVALALTFVMVIIHALMGGLTATAWQSMIAKIIPKERRGIFYGTQSAAANLLSSIAAVIAGLILAAASGSTVGFALCFFLAGVLMMASLGFLAQTRESESVKREDTPLKGAAFRRSLVAILRRDRNFRIFIITRMLIQIASVGSAFYSVYTVRRFEADAAMAGVLTGIYLLAATISNPVCGWLGDKYGHRRMFAFGALLAGTSAFIALMATSASWFIIVFILFGFSHGAQWTSSNALLLDFGSEKDRPFYVGLGNTLVAPVTLLTPLIGGWLSDAVSFEATFLCASAAGVLTAIIAFFVMREPKHSVIHTTPEPVELAMHASP